MCILTKKKYMIFSCGVTSTHYNSSRILVLTTQKTDICVAETCPD